MSDTTITLRRKITGATDLQGVVRTMKAVAASSIGQFERSVSALAEYHHAVEVGLGACLRQNHTAPVIENKQTVPRSRTVIVFGSDQGLVGRFNDVVAEFTVKTLGSLPAKVWAVGERVHAQLTVAGLPPAGTFPLPGSVKAITPLVGRILVETETGTSHDDVSELHLFFNRPLSGGVFAPVSQRLLPLDLAWQRERTNQSWPTGNIPEIMNTGTSTLRAFIREYLFVSLFRACAESLESENASRLAAMQRADKNINELLDELQGRFYRLRQSGIDAELFDVVSGFEALKTTGY